MCDSIRDCGYDADHFTIAVSLPVSLAIRSHSMNIFLSEKLETFDEDDVVPIKQVWKWLFSAKVGKFVDKKYVSGDACEFFVELEILHKEDAEELEAL